LVPGRNAERIAVLGRRGGVSVRDRDVVEAAVARLGEFGDLTEEHAGSSRADAARYLGSRWSMTFRWEPGDGRFSVILPSGARTLGLLPSKGEAAVVFVSGSIFEIWHGNRWLAFLESRGLAPDVILEVEDLEQL